MRATLVLAGATVCLCLTPSALAQQDFVPYTAYVQTELAPIHSGPGPDFYATDALAWGKRVRIYKQDSSGWCAIRPPDGSFSWVEHDKLRTSSDPDVAQVITEGAVCYVGTRFGDDHDVHHVRLKQDELVEILETATLEDSPGDAAAQWAKIAPPAGEFRWILAEYIAKTPPRRDDPVDRTQREDSNDESTPDENEPALVAPSSSNWVAVAPDDSEVSLAAHQTELGAGTSVSESESAASTAPSSPTEPQAESSASTGRSWRPGAHAFRDATIPAGSLDLKTRELNDVDVRLSQTVSQDTSFWDLDDLQSRVEAVIDTSGNARQRDRARRLLGVIVQFQDIKRRHQRLTGANIGSLDLAQGSRLDPSVAGSGTSPYDGTGWLMPVVTQRNGVPRYALTDRNGRILQFVTPSPGVNLRRFEREQIGVIGRRGYVPRLRTPHLMAQRVVVLSRHQR